MKVKIIEIYPRTFDYSDNDYGYYQTLTFYSVADSTNWDEVTEGEYQILKDWADNRNSKSKENNKVLIVTESGVSPPKAIKDYLAYIKEEKIKAAKSQEEAAAKKLLADKAKKQKSLAKKQKQLAQLQKELGL